MKRLLLPGLLILTIILAAYSATLASDDQSLPVSTESDQTAISSTTRVDEQGAIVFEITPLNLASPTDTLEFDVKMTTHTVDLSMNLATLATLTSDTGVTVASTLWDAPRGGHHVQGKLMFPTTQDGKSILENATKLTLTIIDVDAPSRLFEWELK